MSPSDTPAAPAHGPQRGGRRLVPDWFSRLSPRRRIASAAGAGVVVVAVVVLIVSTVLPNTTPRKGHGKGSPTHTVAAKTTSGRKTGPLCPLTGERAPGGKVPNRPAIGVKIGNDEASRPQSGLQEADIVYEEMAEGGITRYLAVYQCHDAPVLGPVRSVRWDDWHVLASYGHPILAFSGGIDQWNAVVASLTWLYDANGSFYPAAGAYYRTSNRVAPWNLYTSTAALWKLDSSNRAAPPAQFHYRPRPASSASAASGATIVGFASGENVVWRWSAKAKDWERYYGSQPDLDAKGQQLHATNVVIQVVTTAPGPYAESGDVPDTDSITEGSGTAYLLRDGKVERGTWDTPSYGDRMGLRLADGQVMALSPGNTWVEMVPDEYAVQISH